jgi:EAL domain-containing protein (putative c-di-GMP-specific phosphodiesterase class I)
VTGLNNKSSFKTDIKQLLTENTEAFIYLIRLDCLTDMVKEQSSDAIDEFLRDCANSLKGVIANLPENQAGVYHFFGAEFALLVREINVQQAEQMAKLLSSNLAELGSKYLYPDIAHIGVTPFNPLDTTEGMLAAANEAFEQAKLIGANTHYIRTRGDQAKNVETWKSLVFNVIDSDAYTVSYVDPIESFQTGHTLMKEAFIQVPVSDGQSVSIGTFVSIAEKFEKIVALDKGVIERVINYIEKNHIQYEIAVNVSTRTVKHSNFQSWLAMQLNQHHPISAQLVFSISAYAVAKDDQVFKEFIQFVHVHNAKVIIKRFDTQSMSLETARELNPDYIRLGRELGNGVCRNPGKQAFIECIKEFGQLLDISVLAENIHSNEDFAAIKVMGIAGASRDSGQYQNKINEP